MKVLELYRELYKKLVQNDEMEAFAQYIKQNNINVDEQDQDNSGFALIHLAAKNARYDLVRALIYCKANLNLVTKKDSSVIELVLGNVEKGFFAEKSERWKMIAELLKAGSREKYLINYVFTRDRVVWADISNTKYPEPADEQISFIIDLIYYNTPKKEFDLNLVDTGNISPLGWATYYGLNKSAETLLERGAHVDGGKDTPVDKTPLAELLKHMDQPHPHLFSYRGPAIELLIKHGAKSPSERLLANNPGWITRALLLRDMQPNKNTYNPQLNAQKERQYKDAETQTELLMQNLTIQQNDITTLAKY